MHQSTHFTVQLRLMAPDILHVNESTVTFDELVEECLLQRAKWGPDSDISRLRALIPETDESVRRFVLIELIKFDMALAAEAGQLRPIERYVDAFSDLLSSDTVPLDLLLEEIQLRKEAGEHPSRSDYARRFPQFDDMLSQLLGDGEATAALSKLGPPPELSLNSRLDDFYLLQKLGKGAFAHVYLARQISMQRLVALKVSRGKGDEPKALAQFDHPNIVRVFDQREIPDPHVHMLYMQFHPGGTLADVVKCVRVTGNAVPTGRMLLDCIDKNLLATSQIVPDNSATRDWIGKAQWPMVVAWLGIQLARALHEAHRQGVLHRDVKPANVLLSAEGVPKLADFNVSLAGAAGRAGAAAVFGGSIGYMAPEHLRAILAHTKRQTDWTASGSTGDSDVREAADLYSLAVLLWELWQGQRPFVTDSVAISWSDMVVQQLQSRMQDFQEPHRDGNASERVLEKTLRLALSPDPQKRLSSGAELAGRLRLAMHPEAAVLFDPGESTINSRVARLSLWLVACAIILLPNVAGGFFNYQYNELEVMKTPERMEGLANVSWWVNLTFFPFGAVIVIWFAKGVMRAVQSVRGGARVTHRDLMNTLELGHRAAVISGSLWLIAGILFPVVFALMFADFSLSDAVHLFISSLICGGVAMIYPFFGMALVASLVYYPLLLSVSMQDDEFDARWRLMVHRSEMYLLIAAIIPVLGAALMVSSESSSRGFVLIALAAGVLGLLASAAAYRVVTDTWARLGEVLSSRTSSVPGEQ